MCSVDLDQQIQISMEKIEKMESSLKTDRTFNKQQFGS